MGLDMYLNAEVMAPFGETVAGEALTPLAAKVCEIEATTKPVLPLPFDDELSFEQPSVLSIDIRLGYWRKANAIHGWIVENVGDGVDECQRINLSRDDLATLRDLALETLTLYREAETPEERNLACAERLPTTQGCFFGSYEYDEGYAQDLEQTVRILNRTLALLDAEESDPAHPEKRGCWIDVYYRASW